MPRRRLDFPPLPWTTAKSGSYRVTNPTNHHVPACPGIRQQRESKLKTSAPAGGMASRWAPLCGTRNSPKMTSPLRIPTLSLGPSEGKPPIMPNNKAVRLHSEMVNSSDLWSRVVRHCGHSYILLPSGTERTILATAATSLTGACSSSRPLNW